MTAIQLRTRREALTGKPFYVQFYGAWHCIEGSTGRATRCKSFDHALTLAEDRNSDAE